MFLRAFFRILTNLSRDVSKSSKSFEEKSESLPGAEAVELGVLRLKLLDDRGALLGVQRTWRSCADELLLWAESEREALVGAAV